MELSKNLKTVLDNISDISNTAYGYAKSANDELNNTDKVLDEYVLFNGPFYFEFDDDVSSGDVNTTITLTAVGSPTASPTNLQWSYDKKRWYDYDNGLWLSKGTRVYLRSKAPNTYFTDINNYYKFSVTGHAIKIGGDITSLIKEDIIDNTKISTSLNRLFINNTLITDASNLNLPATILGVDSVYSNMFASNTGLKKAPKLPATTLTYNCYGGMFNGCTALTDAPALPATQLATSCYNWMFNYCSALSAAPDLPAETATPYCYQRMFCGCSNLVNPPKMELTTVAQGCCDVMFWYCSKLETAPYLPATTLAQGCYGGMFNSCTSLKSISAEFTDWNSAQSSTGNWVYNVGASGDFYCPSALPYETGNARIPASWTVHTH